MDSQLKKDVETVIEREMRKSLQSASRHKGILERLQREHPVTWFGQKILSARISHNQRKLLQKQKEISEYREALTALQRGDPRKAIDVLDEIISETIPVSVFNADLNNNNFFPETPNPAFEHLMRLWRALNEEIAQTETSAA